MKINRQMQTRLKRLHPIFHPTHFLVGSTGFSASPPSLPNFAKMFYVFASDKIRQWQDQSCMNVE